RGLRGSRASRRAGRPHDRRRDVSRRVSPADAGARRRRSRLRSRPRARRRAARVVTVRARTHPAAYLLHKYWSRKPHNVLRSLFERAPRGLFLDPFCGSGVALSEAAALGFECAGADVNPIARAITRVTLDPPDPREVERVVGALLDRAA